MPTRNKSLHKDNSLQRLITTPFWNPLLCIPSHQKVKGWAIKGLEKDMKNLGQKAGFVNKKRGWLYHASPSRLLPIKTIEPPPFLLLHVNHFCFFSDVQQYLMRIKK